MSVTIFLLFAGVVLGLENVERYQPVEITRSGDARLIQSAEGRVAMMTVKTQWLDAYRCILRISMVGHVRP